MNVYIKLTLALIAVNEAHHITEWSVSIHVYCGLVNCKYDKLYLSRGKKFRKAFMHLSK